MARSVHLQNYMPFLPILRNKQINTGMKRVSTSIGLIEGNAVMITTSSLVPVRNLRI